MFEHARDELGEILVVPRQGVHLVQICIQHCGRRSLHSNSYTQQGIVAVLSVGTNGNLGSFVISGMTECTLALNDRLVLEAAAREGARRAAIEGGATARVYERIDALLRAGHLDPAHVEVKISPWSAPYGHSIWVTVSYGHRFITPPVRAALGDGVDLEAKALSRSERLR